MKSLSILICALLLSVDASAQSNTVQLKPIAPPSCTAGYGCIYTSNVDGLLYTRDANNLTLKLHSAQGFQTSTNCAGLPLPKQGDVCYDTTLKTFRFYGSTGWQSGLIGSTAPQGANTVFAGPTSGPAAPPSFRLLEAADLSNALGTTTGLLRRSGPTTYATIADGVGNQILTTDALGVPQYSSLIRFPALATQPYASGQLYFDSPSNSLVFHNADSNVALNIGQEMWLPVRNQTGVSIANGAPVYQVGSAGGVPLVALAQANSAATSEVIGLMTETCPNNTDCFVTLSGRVNGLNTSGFADGAPLYLSAASPGVLTATSPSAPNLSVKVGFCSLSDMTAGHITVNPRNPINPTLNALANFNTNGYLVQTGASTFAGRTFVAGDGSVTVANGNGGAGNTSYAVNYGTPVATGLANSAGAAVTAARSDHVHDTGPHASRHLQGGSDPIIAAPLDVNGAIVLTAANRYVHIHTTGPYTLTLPTAPSNGTLIDIVYLAPTMTGAVTIARGGADTIMDAGMTSFFLGGHGSNARLQYDAGLARWHILNLKRYLVTTYITSMSANNYVQQPAVLLLGNVTYNGGALGTAVCLALPSGTIMTGNLYAQARTNVGAATTIKIRKAAADFSAASDFANNWQVTIPNGNSGAFAAARNFESVNPTTAPQQCLVIQAVTNVNNALTVQFEVWTL